MFALLSDWFTTISLVFGGCCSNAITLEQLTSQYPNAGSLITLFQFLLISLHGLPKHLTWTRYGPRFKPRRIPLTPYLVQVALFYLVSLLNNAAFAYRIPMAVHIIFRSGGLVISMLLGWLLSGKRYSLVQVASVLLVTAGVIITTLSASGRSSSSMDSDGSDIYAYLTGIAILTVALLFSGFLGLVQDYTYSKYGRPSPTPSISEKELKTAAISNGQPGNAHKASPTMAPAWQESMFYLHFLALPMFFFIREDIVAQFNAVNTGARTSFSFVVPPSISSVLDPALSIPPPFAMPFSFLGNSSSLYFERTKSSLLDSNAGPITLHTHIPSAYLPLLLNTITQLVCVAGVHRLTTSVSSLTVTLVLVVRKAVSLILSILLDFGGSGKGDGVDMRMMWGGAAMVMLGTVGYSLGSGKKAAGKQKKE